MVQSASLLPIRLIFLPRERERETDREGFVKKEEGRSYDSWKLISCQKGKKSETGLTEMASSFNVYNSTSLAVAEAIESRSSRARASFQWGGTIFAMWVLNFFSLSYFKVRFHL